MTLKGIFPPLAQPQNITLEGIEFIQAVSMGLIEGASFLRKFSSNPSMNTGVGFRDMWEFGSTALGNVNYTYPADGTAPIDSISSSDAGDNQDSIIEGLDVNGNFVSQESTLNGNTRVALATTLWRVWRIYNNEPTGTADLSTGYAGNVYVYVNSAITLGVPDDANQVKGFVSGTNNQSLQSPFTIPNGTFGLFLGHQSKILRKVAAAVGLKLHIRPFGKPFRIFDIGMLNSQGTSALVDTNLIPGLIPEKTDIIFSADTDLNGTSAAVNYSLLLFDRSKWLVPGDVRTLEF